MKHKESYRIVNKHEIISPGEWQWQQALRPLKLMNFNRRDFAGMSAMKHWIRTKMRNSSVPTNIVVPEEIRDSICESASPMNNSTSGFLQLDHNAIVRMFSWYSRHGGGSSMIEAKHGHKLCLVVRISGAPSACRTKVIVFVAEVVQAYVEERTLESMTSIWNQRV